MLHRNHFPMFFVLTLLQGLYEYFYLNPRAERKFHECAERAALEGVAGPWAQVVPQNRQS